MRLFKNRKKPLVPTIQDRTEAVVRDADAISVSSTSPPKPTRQKESGGAWRT
jgi:hypothetical protein